MTTFLFDMDGTLFDTEKYYNRAWKQAISDSGYELPEEEVLKLRSLGRPFALNSFNAGLDRRWITWQSGNIAKN